MFQLKSLINSIEKSLAYKKLGIFGNILAAFFKIKDVCLTIVKKLHTKKSVFIKTPPSSENSYKFDPLWTYIKASVFSEYVVKNSDYNIISIKRRRNYQALHKALSDLPFCEPLYKSLPNDVTPHVYPLKFHHPQKYFSILKQKGVPIWRFGEYLDDSITAKEFPISYKLSKNVLQFPCHQSLSQQDLDWIISTIKETVVA